MDAKLVLLHALSPLHAGTGRGVGMIDLPIAREKVTGIPYLPGSSLKGVLRAASPKEKRDDIFGTEANATELYAGAVNFSDLRILLFPVRSLRGTFAWVTSPLILRRFLRDARASNYTEFDLQLPEPADHFCFVSSEKCKINSDKKVILEELELKANSDEVIDLWAQKLGEALFPENDYWQEALQSRLCLVSDDMMGFLLETGTEVVARIALDEKTKVVKNGALWYEEALPAETVLSGIVSTTKIKLSSEEIYQTLGEVIQNPLQVGGNASVGRGLSQLRLLDA
jgi:CRISPR-associated protein Cmr4